jgi:Domain of unknown function (DUF4249)
MKLSFYFIIVSTFFSACQEVYEPDINLDLWVLTVDGLLTDNAEPYHIHLQRALPGDSSGIATPVSGAEVSITDDLSHIYPFNETVNGNYVINNSVFALQPDRKYTLRIITTDGNKYESSSQELIPNKEIDKIYGRLTIKPMVWKNKNGEYVRTDNKGVETFIDFFSNPGQSFTFKFNATLLIEYTYRDGLTDDVLKKTKYYAWGKWDLNETINITETKYQNGNHEIVSHPLPFFPVEKSWYSLEPDLWKTNFQVTHWILIIDQFRLNEDSYIFYRKIREQLAAEGKLFDPIAAQINGNIRCTNNPSRLVLGNFEVSSKETITYVASTDYVTNTVTYRKIPNLLNIPDEGAVEFKNLPDWWIE